MTQKGVAKQCRDSEEEHNYGSAGWKGSEYYD